MTLPNDKPPFKKGDLLAIPQDQQPYGRSVYNGLCVVVADSDPVQRFADGYLQWCYGFTPWSQLRLATQTDLERLIDIANKGVAREMRRLNHFVELLKQYFPGSYTGCKD